MIKIILAKENDIVKKIISQGHAGGREKVSIQVCASVSTLLYGFLYCLNESGVMFRERIKNGYFFLEILSFEKKQENELKAYQSFLLLGLEALQNQYPTMLELRFEK